MSRRMLKEAKALKVPALPDVDVVPMTRMELALAVGITPDEWQRRVLESGRRKILMCCCRQSGKSTTAALLAVHEAVTTPGALVLMLAPSMRQSAELFRTALGIIKSLDVTVPAIVMESVLRLELAHGSRIIALPGSESTTRGYGAATMVILDEASRVPDSLIAAVRPALATTNGRLIALSTPAGKRGWFFLEWSNGEGWQRSNVVAKGCPRISAEFLADELRSLGPRIYAQEYECEFFDPDTAVFSSALIEQALCAELLPLWSLT